jgi:hypothetical protein
MQIKLHPDTIAFLTFEFEDILQNCHLEEPTFEDIANLLNLLTNIGEETISISQV